MSAYDPTMAPPQSFRQALVFVLFYGLFLVIGLFLVVFPLWFFVWGQWRANNVFLEAEGVVLAKRIQPSEGDLIPQVRVRYRVGAQEIENWSTQTPSFILGEDGRPPPAYERIRIGERRPVWFDPASPSQFVLERIYGIFWPVYPMVGLGLLFALSAGWTIVRGLRSWQRVAAPRPEETSDRKR